MQRVSIVSKSWAFLGHWLLGNKMQGSIWKVPLSQAGQPDIWLCLQFVSPRLRNVGQHLLLLWPPMVELYKDTDPYLDNSLHSKTFSRPCISPRRSYVKQTRGLQNETVFYIMHPWETKSSSQQIKGMPPLTPTTYPEAEPQSLQSPEHAHIHAGRGVHHNDAHSPRCNCTVHGAHLHTCTPPAMTAH